MYIRREFTLALVEVTGLEPAASCSQNRSAANCATPRYGSLPRTRTEKQRILSAHAIPICVEGHMVYLRSGAVHDSKTKISSNYHRQGYY